MEFPKLGIGVPKQGAVEIPMAQHKVKYPKPKVLLVDTDASVFGALSKAGFNVNSGTLGKPYRVEKHSDYQPIIGEVNLPNRTEQEIVVVDLDFGQPSDHPNGERSSPKGEPGLWAKCSRGIIDPRALGSLKAQKSFDRILENGGAFVVFGAEKLGIEMSVATDHTSDYGGLYNQEVFSEDAWDFLSHLKHITVDGDHGEEMKPTDTQSQLGILIARYLPESRFTCTLHPPYNREEPWLTLAQNKYGSPVAIYRDRGSKGLTIILPQLKNKGEFLTELFTQVLPALAPRLFPHFQTGGWTHRPEYELFRILELQREQERIKARANTEIEQINKSVVEERSQHGWMHDLLTGTDAVLVDAVKKALHRLGFTKVVDVDEERDREGKERREDLQIHDLSPALVVDIKGLSGHPADSEAFQSHKHATLRIQEWKRFDVQALTIINHWKHLPPLERDNVMPFRQEILTFAEEVKMGVITAWDLYRLVRNAAKWNWTPEQTKPVLYRIGRFDPIPEHYKYLGTIAHIYTGVVSIQIEENELRVGDRIAFELDVDFEEQQVMSLQVNKQDVEVANAGGRAGTKTELERPTIREGTRVFVVR